MRRIMKVALVAAATTAIAIGSSTAAQASVSIDATGKGFVGKGDVQTALGYNNSTLQKAVDAKSLVFTAQQPTSQALTQGVSQSGTQRERRPEPSSAPRPASSPPRRWCRRT